MTDRTIVRFGPVDIVFDEAVLRPRQWTLAQSEWAAELAAGDRMLEIGCGAGQIGLAAAVLSESLLVQVDRDPAACRWAAHNAAANGFAERVEQRCGTAEDVLAPDELFPVVIADPPYVPSRDARLYPEDPLGAIDGGPDGLDAPRAFVQAAAAHLAPGGSVVLQLRGPAQVDLLAEWLDGGCGPPLAVVDTRSFGDTRALARLTNRRR